MSGYRVTADFIARSLLHMWKPILQIIGNMSDWFRSKSVGTRPCNPVTCMPNIVLISREMKKFLDQSGQAVARWVTGRERCLTGPSTLGPHRPRVSGSKAASRVMRAPCRRWEGALPERAACPTQEKYLAGKIFIIRFIPNLVCILDDCTTKVEKIWWTVMDITSTWPPGDSGYRRTILSQVEVEHLAASN